MRIAYFDCFSGAAGDMILGALISAGLSPDDLRHDLGRLNLTGYELDIRPIMKQGFAAHQVVVGVQKQESHRHLHDIEKIIGAADLPAPVKERSLRTFRRLAEAEAQVHGTTIEKVHFHEVGAVDAIVDIVGAAIGLHRLGIERVVCSPIPTGGGTVRCEHGLMPVPAPATAELLVGVPLADSEEPAELTTPTGAAILTTAAEAFGPPPAMRIGAIGYGAGTREGVTRPNILRVLLGEIEDADGIEESVVVLEANLDDATGEEIGHAIEALFAAGALDAFTVPIQMKKNRPGVLLTVIASPAKAAACEDVLLTHTPTFGVRRAAWARTCLDRTVESVTTRFGVIRVKIGRRGGAVVRVAPEFEDCAAAARSQSVPLREVMREAERAWRAAHSESDG